MLSFIFSFLVVVFYHKSKKWVKSAGDSSWSQTLNGSRHGGRTGYTGWLLMWSHWLHWMALNMADALITLDDSWCAHTGYTGWLSPWRAHWLHWMALNMVGTLFTLDGSLHGRHTGYTGWLSPWWAHWLHWMALDMADTLVTLDYSCHGGHTGFPVLLLMGLLVSSPRFCTEPSYCSFQNFYRPASLCILCRAGLFGGCSPLPGSPFLLTLVYNWIYPSSFYPSPESQAPVFRPTKFLGPFI